MSITQYNENIRGNNSGVVRLDSKFLNDDIIMCSYCGNPLTIFSLSTLLCKKCNTYHTLHSEHISSMKH